MDLNKNAFRIVRSLTEEKEVESPRKVSASQAGKAGGRARANRLTSSERHDIAVKASRARWRNAT